MTYRAEAGKLQKGIFKLPGSLYRSDQLEMGEVALGGSAWDARQWESVEATELLQAHSQCRWGPETVLSDDCWGEGDVTGRVGREPGGS